MTTAPVWQTAVFAAAAVVAVVGQITLDLSLGAQLALLAPLVAILGLPHGALDLPIAEALWPLDGWRGKLRFVAIYLGLVAAVIVAWVLVPGIALIAFLAYSVVHFSDDWAGASPPLRWTGGLATIGAPALLHTAEVTALFAYLASPDVAAVSASAAALGGGLAMCALIGVLLVKRQTRGQAAAEQLILWCTAFLLPPLVFFAVYFCGLHSVRHFRATISTVPRARRALMTAIGLSALVTLAAMVVVLVRHDAIMSVSLDTGMRIIFIGLAALTVPHMILVDRFSRQRG